MQPPLYEAPCPAPLPPPGGTSPFKVLLVIFGVLAVCGLILIGSLTAVVVGIYRLASSESPKPIPPNRSAQQEAESLERISQVLAPPTLSGDDFMIKPAAAEKLREAMRNMPVNSHVLVGIDSDSQSCTGFTYRMKTGGRPAERYYCIGVVEGIPIAIERKGWMLLQGATLDYQVVSDSVAGFVFDNPNAASAKHSAPGDTSTSVAAHVTPVTPQATPADISLIDGVSRPVKDIQHAIQMTQHGSENDCRRVLKWMDAYRFDQPGNDEPYDKLADEMDDRRKALPAEENKAARTTVRSWRSRAMHASVAITEATETPSKSDLAKEDKFHESNAAVKELAEATQRLGKALESPGGGVRGSEVPFLPPPNPETPEEAMKRIHERFRVRDPLSGRSSSGSEILEGMQRGHRSPILPGASSSNSDRVLESIHERHRKWDEERRQREQKWEEQRKKMDEERERRHKELMERVRNPNIDPLSLFPPR